MRAFDILIDEGRQPLHIFCSPSLSTKMGLAVSQIFTYNY